jgi:LysR family glycine cleavage system transcriptional activator
MDKRAQSLPPLEWIRVFEAAGRTGSFTEAGKQTGLTQAAVSQRIRNLENHLGASLFERQARGVTLSVDGEAWLPHVQNALAALTHSTVEFFGSQRSKTTIAASTSVIQLWIIPRLERLMDAHPNMQVLFATVHREPDFAVAEADFEVRFGNGNWSERRAIPLFAEELAPVAAPALMKDHGEPWQELPRISVSGPRIGWQEWSTATGAPTPPLPALRFDTFVQALRAAEAGAGVMLASLQLCQSALRGKRLRRLTRQSVKMESGYWITWPISHAHFSQQEAMARCLTDAPGE